MIWQNQIVNGPYVIVSQNDTHYRATVPAKVDTRFACLEYDCFQCTPRINQIFRVVKATNSFVIVSNIFSNDTYWSH